MDFVSGLTVLFVGHFDLLGFIQIDQPDLLGVSSTPEILSTWNSPKQNLPK